MITPEIVNNVLAELRSYRGKWGTFPAAETPKLEYHVMADAVFWSDEFPRPTPGELENAFRLVINHRTSLLLGEEGRFSEVWNVAKDCYPYWPGFRMDRCTSNAEIADRIKRIRRVSSWKIDRLAGKKLDDLTDFNS